MNVNDWLNFGCLELLTLSDANHFLVTLLTLLHWALQSANVHLPRSVDLNKIQTA